MTDFRRWQYRVSRRLGRLITTTAAVLTLGRMPPFVSTSAIVVEGDKLLVVIDPIRQEPVLPGGHLKWREGPEAALVREVYEETGFHVATTGLHGVFSGEVWAGEPGVLRVIYTARVTGGALRSSPEGEARWCAIADLVSSSTRDRRLIAGWAGLTDPSEPR